MNNKTFEITLIDILKKKNKIDGPFDIEVSNLSFSEIEALRYQLMNRGINCDFYSEFKKRYIAIF